MRGEGRAVMTYWLGTGINSDDKNELVTLKEIFPNSGANGGIIKRAEDFTLRIRRAFIDQHYDAFGYNDLMITSSFQFAEKPPVPKLHFLKNNCEDLEIDTFISENILCKTDFKEQNLRLHIQVSDIDRIPRKFISTVETATKSIGLVFPHLAPHAVLADGVAKGIEKVIDETIKHDRILEGKLILRKSKEGRRRDLLQTGYYVCIQGDQNNEERLYLDKECVVRYSKTDEVYKANAYVILELKRGSEEDYAMEINQMAATLISELNGNGFGNESPIHFLTDTLKGYDNFKKIKRYHELKGSSKLNKSEKLLLEKLKKDPEISEYIE